MIAGAKNIAPSMVEIVYVCNVVPSFMVKATGPYWFHYFPYKLRMIIASILTALSFIMVAIGESSKLVWMQLLGVVIGSLQSGFGEASYLALTAFYRENSRTALTYWSSGTGAAGIFGYGWVVVFTAGLKASFALTLYAAFILPVLFIANFLVIIKPPAINREAGAATAFSDEHIDANDTGSDEKMIRQPLLVNHAVSQQDDEQGVVNAAVVAWNEDTTLDEVDLSQAAAVMSVAERLHRTALLWPFMLPLVIVVIVRHAVGSVGGDRVLFVQQQRAQRLLRVQQLDVPGRCAGESVLRSAGKGRHDRSVGDAHASGAAATLLPAGRVPAVLVRLDSAGAVLCGGVTGRRRVRRRLLPAGVERASEAEGGLAVGCRTGCRHLRGVVERGWHIHSAVNVPLPQHQRRRVVVTITPTRRF